MLQQVIVLALQAQADPFSQDVREHRGNEYRDLRDAGCGVEGDVQLVSDDVVGAFEPEHAVERDHGDPDGRPGGRIARPVVDVVLALIAGDPLLDEWP